MRTRGFDVDARRSLTGVTPAVGLSEETKRLRGLVEQLRGAWVPRIHAKLGEKRTIKMRFDGFGDLWVGDYHDGPKVLAPDGRIVGAKLGAFIDHTTRYPVADRWYLTEDVASLRDTLLRALLTFGPPRVAYTDRGACYRAEQLA